MEAEAPPGSPDAPQGGQLAKPGADRPAERPWRTEGLPKGQPPDPRRRWINGALRSSTRQRRSLRANDHPHRATMTGTGQRLTAPSATLPKST